MEIHVKVVFLGQLDQKLLQILFLNMRIMAKMDQKNAKTEKWLALRQKSIFFQNSFFLYFFNLLVTDLGGASRFGQKVDLSPPLLILFSFFFGKLYASVPLNPNM